MSKRLPPILVLSAIFLVWPCQAQQSLEVSTRPLRPLKRQELERREALELFGIGVEHEHRNRLPEALRTYEQALRLNPDAAPVLRALVPLYLALDRQQEALDACKRIVTLDPEDFETWQNYARQLRSADRDEEARKALLRASACKELAEQPDAHLAILHDLGTLHEKVSAYREAEAAFREVIKLLERPLAPLEQGGISAEEIGSQTADVYERVGRLCLKMKQTERAIAAFQTAQLRDPARAARLSFNLAEVLIEQKRDAEALGYLDRYLARQPSGVEGYELKLKLLHRLGRDQEIIKALERHARDDPYNNALKLLLGREYQKVNRLGDAENIYTALLSAPQAEVYRGLFGLYRQQGKSGMTKLLARFDSAVAAASRDDREKPADSAQAGHARAMLGTLREDRELVKALLAGAGERILNGPRLAYKTRILLAALAERTDQADVAERIYRSCLDKEGRVQVTGSRTQTEAEVYGGLLRVLVIGRRHQAVVELCKQGLDQVEASNCVMLRLELASALAALGRSKEAQEAVNAAVASAVDAEGHKDRFLCRLRRASLLSDLDRHKEAEAECLALLKEYKEDEDVRSIRFRLAGVYSQAKQAKKSEEQLKIILQADPLDAHANNDLGYQWADQNKNLDEAERMIRKALKLDREQRNTKDSLSIDADRENAAYVDSLGWILFRRGKLKEARVELEKAAHLPEGIHDPVVWDHLGDVCKRMKDSAGASAAWSKALKQYEEGNRSRSDERYRDIQRKLKGL
jgi:tetratricopeptide (TPR) repeat protein